MGRPKSTTTMQRRGSSAGGAAGEASYSYAAVEGFQVVFLVQSDDGDGKMFPLVQQGHVKSLLSIANIPLLAHQLRAFHSVGFTEAIVVCEEAAKKDVQNVISQYVPDLQCNVVCVEAEVSANSIDLLKAARPHLQPSSEVIVVGGDIVTDAAITEMLGYKSIKKQFVSYLVRQQHRSSGTEAIPASAQKRWEEYHQIQRMSPQLPKTSTIKSSSSPDVVQCYALVPGECFGMRLDSVDNFVEMNKHVAHERAIKNTTWPLSSPEEFPHSL